MPDFSSGQGGGEHGAPVRRSATAETGDLLADLVVEGARTIAFVRSRRGAESVSLSARRALQEAAPSLVAAGGGLPRGLPARGAAPARAAAAVGRARRRRGHERARARPGRLGARRRRPDRAGRARSPRSGSRPAGPDGPGRARSRSSSRATTRSTPTSCTTRRRCSGGRWRRPCSTRRTRTSSGRTSGCAAVELPLTEADLPLFGDPDDVRLLLGDLVRRGVLRARPRGWFWTSRDRPDVDIRGTGGPPVRLVEAGTGRLLGTVDAAASHTQAHTGAVYLHQGESWVVDHLDLEESVALVHAEEPDHTTSAREVTDITDRRPPALDAPYDGVDLVFGTVDVTHQVVSYLKKRAGSGEVLGRGAARPAAAPAADAGGLVHGRARPARGRGHRVGGRAGRRARRRARRDRPAAAVRHLRPLGHRRGVDRSAPRHRHLHRLRLRRPPGRRRLRRAGLRPRRRLAAGDPRGDRRLRVPGRAARRACSRPSAATATSRWTRRAPCTCSTWSWRAVWRRWREGKGTSYVLLLDPWSLLWCCSARSCSSCAWCSAPASSCPTPTRSPPRPSGSRCRTSRSAASSSRASSSAPSPSSRSACCSAAPPASAASGPRSSARCAPPVASRRRWPSATPGSRPSSSASAPPPTRRTGPRTTPRPRT